MIGSVNARIGRGTNTAYITAKAALEGLTRGMASEVATRGVTVNCTPGYIATEINTVFAPTRPATSGSATARR
ncbi:MAG: SDR family NAD(P)-dependent oxidoreductase [Rhodoferax sp.]